MQLQWHLVLKLTSTILFNIGTVKICNLGERISFYLHKVLKWENSCISETYLDDCFTKFFDFSQNPKIFNFNIRFKLNDKKNCIQI